MNALFENDMGHNKDTVYFWLEVHEDLYKEAESTHPGIIANTMRTMWEEVYGTNLQVGTEYVILFFIAAFKVMPLASWQKRANKLRSIMLPDLYFVIVLIIAFIKRDLQHFLCRRVSFLVTSRYRNMICATSSNCNTLLFVCMS